MSRNGTGTFVRLNNFVTDKTNSVPITASRVDAEFDGMATALTQSIAVNGESVITANIPMASNKFTGLSVGNARTDSITLGQVQDGQFTALGTTGGAADAYTATPSPAITAYTTTMQFSAKIHATNLTTTPTLLISAVPNGTIKKFNAVGAEIAVEASDLLAGKIYHFHRNPANDGWIVENPDKPYINITNIAGLLNKNTIINGSMGIDQRNAGAAQTITAAAALAYTVDRWYAYCTGANVTGQRVAGTTPNQYNYQFTGAASVTKIGFAQRIEAANSQHLAGNTATLSVDLANSLLTTVTWVASYANTADTFGSLASPTITQIATGTFTVSSSITRFSTNITVPSAAITGIQIEFSVAAQTSGTWTIGRAQLELGSATSPFDNKTFQEELMLCQRYYQKSFPYATAPAQNLGRTGAQDFYQTRAAPNTFVSPSVRLPVVMRTTGTITIYNPSAANSQVRNVDLSSDCTSSAGDFMSDGKLAVSGNLATSTTITNLFSYHYAISSEL